MLPMSRLKYLLVSMNQPSGSVEDFPTRKADTAGMDKALLWDIIPSYKKPETIQSNRGSHFFKGNTKQYLWKFRNTAKTTCSISSTVLSTGGKNEQVSLSKKNAQT